MVKEAVLRWKHEFKSNRGILRCGMSNISASGDVAIAATYGEDVSGELILFNSEGKVVWKEYYNHGVYYPQLSDDGNIITLRKGNKVLIAYNKKGKILWVYNIGEKATKELGLYKLSRDGRYVTITTSDGDRSDTTLRLGELVLLRDGNVM